jgi:hypothetical protein
LRHTDIPGEIIELVHNEAWGFSAEVYEALENGEFTTDDLSRCVLEGRLHKRERDEKKTAADGWKYTIWGPSSGGHRF